jgi:hypothetical protein
LKGGVNNVEEKLNCSDLGDIFCFSGDLENSG